MSAAPAAPRITTVIPTYRRPELLRRAIRSVLNQTFRELEICVYDNASGDETGKFVGELAAADGRVKYFCHAQNIGAAPNFVFGMSRVQTPFFSLLSDDDVVLPDFFEKALALFSRFPDAMFSALATIRADNEGRATAVPVLAWREGIYPPPSGLFEILNKQQPEITGTLFRQEVLREVGTLDPEAGLFADLDYECRIAARWPIAVSREPGAIFVSHRDSLSMAVPLETDWAFRQRICANLQRDEKIPPEVRARACEQILAAFYRGSLAHGGLGHVANRQWDTAESAAKILREGYHRPGRAFVLRSLARIGRKWPWVSAPLRALKRVRKSVRPGVTHEIPPDYARYTQLLKRQG